MEMDSYGRIFFYYMFKGRTHAENVVTGLNGQRIPQFWRFYKKHIAIIEIRVHLNTASKRMLESSRRTIGQGGDVGWCEEELLNWPC